MSEYTKKLVKLNVARFIESGIDSHVNAVVTLATDDMDHPDTEYITLILHNHWSDFGVSIYITDEDGYTEMMVEGDEEIWADGDLYQGWYNMSWYQDEDKGFMETRVLEGGIPEFLALVTEYYEKHKEYNQYSF